MTPRRAAAHAWRLAAAVGGAAVCVWPLGALAEQYSLSFNKSSTRMSWNHRLPSWSYAAPVRFLAAADSSVKLRMSASASINSVLDERADARNWQDNASVSSSINYPILGPRASIRVGANMSVRSATLTQQKIRNQTLDFGIQSKPLQSGRFRSLQVDLTPGVVTASRTNRARLDSVFEERGIQYDASLRVQPEISVWGRKLSNSISVGKRDNTLKSNRNRTESYSTSLAYTLPGEVHTSCSLAETRSQVGVPRSVVAARADSAAVGLDTSVSIESQRTRNTSASSSLSVRLRGLDLRASGSYRENYRTNTASADDAPDNSFFGKDREHTSWDVETSVSGKPAKSLVGRSSLRYSASDEGFLPVRLADGTVYRNASSDLETENLFLNGSLDWKASERHTVKLAAYAEVRTEVNPGAREQDRSTISRSLDLTYDGVTGGQTGISARLERKYLHRINLASSRSADNQRNNDLSLSLSTRYERLGVSASHTFSISARRTIYDFDRQVNESEQSRKSNIRRGWSMVHTARRRVVAGIEANARYSYSADDFGALLVESGAQVVKQDNSDHNISVGVSYSPLTALSIGSSYSYRLGRQWQYDYRLGDEHRYLNRRTENESLSLSADYQPSRSTSLSLRGSRSRQLSGTYDSVSVTYSHTL